MGRDDSDSPSTFLGDSAPDLNASGEPDVPPARPPASVSNLDPSSEIGVWVVEARLGRGGMGSVYRCHNKHAQRIKAAIKLLDPSLLRRGYDQTTWEPSYSKWSEYWVVSGLARPSP